MFYAWKNIMYTLNGFRKSDADIKVIRKQRATTSLHKILRKYLTGRFPCHLCYVCVTEERFGVDGVIFNCGI